MKATTIIIRGEHNKQKAVVTFVYIGRKIWCATVECGDKRVEVRSRRNNGLRPCPTHAGYLLDEHFPKDQTKRKPGVLASRREGRPRVTTRAFPRMMDDQPA